MRALEHHAGRLVPADFLRDRMQSKRRPQRAFHIRGRPEGGGDGKCPHEFAPAVELHALAAHPDDKNLVCGLDSERRALFDDLFDRRIHCEHHSLSSRHRRRHRRSRSRAVSTAAGAQFPHGRAEAVRLGAVGGQDRGARRKEIHGARRRSRRSLRTSTWRFSARADR